MDSFVTRRRRATKGPMVKKSDQQSSLKWAKSNQHVSPKSQPVWPPFQIRDPYPKDTFFIINKEYDKCRLKYFPLVWLVPMVVTCHFLSSKVEAPKTVRYIIYLKSIWIFAWRFGAKLLGNNNENIIESFA
jgi:hypothetical protein